MLNLEVILDNLKSNNYILVNRINYDNFYFELGDTVISLITPHEGNDYSYLLRADKKKNFDRWSNCEFEANFRNYEEMIICIDELNNSFL